MSRHGMNGTPEHGIWRGILKRCLIPSATSYAQYGGRGITVAPEWRHDFAAFYAHIGPRLTPQHSVDRIDNDRGYEPGNVRWATGVEQSANRRPRRPSLRVACAGCGRQVCLGQIARHERGRGHSVGVDAEAVALLRHAGYGDEPTGAVA